MNRTQTSDIGVNVLLAVVATSWVRKVREVYVFGASSASDAGGGGL